MASPMTYAEALKHSRNDLPKYDPNGFTNLEEMMISLEKNLSEYSLSSEDLSEIASRSKRSKVQLIKANIKQVERTKAQIDAETQERIILWLKDQQNNVATTVHPSEKETIWRYHKMMGVFRHLIEAIVRHVASIEDVLLHKDLVRTFAPLLYAAKTSSLRSDDVISLVQEFDQCFKKTMDAIKCLDGSFFVCPKPRNEERILQKILKYLRNRYQPYDTEIEQMEALIKEAERTQKQIDAETQERIILWLKEQRNNMTITVHPSEKEIIFQYPRMMRVVRQLIKAVVPLIATVEDFIMPKDVMRAFAPLFYATKTSRLRSDDVKSSHQEFNECFKNTVDAIKSLDDSFFVCRKPWNEERILQKILKELRNRSKAYETDGIKEMRKDGFDSQKALNIPVNEISPLPDQPVKDNLERLRKLMIGQPVDMGFIAGMNMARSRWLLEPRVDIT